MVDDHLAAERRRGEEPAVAADHRVEVLRRRDADEDVLGSGRDFGCGADGGRAERLGRRARRCADVGADDLVPGRDQPFHEALPHEAEADKADGCHEWVSLSAASRGSRATAPERT